MPSVYFDTNTFAPFQVPKRDGEVFKCKNCGGPNKLDAYKCRYCDYTFSTPPVIPTPVVSAPNIADLLEPTFSVTSHRAAELSSLMMQMEEIKMPNSRDTVTMIIGGIMAGATMIFFLSWTGALRFFGL